MTTFEAFAREIRLATEGLSQEAISAELAKFAKEELARAISSGEAPATYTRYVNGREGVPEEAVEAPGPILYVFSNWKIVIEAALEALIHASPRKSGDFRKSFVVIVGGKAVTAYDDIPSEAEVIITNAQPYVRKIQVSRGGSRFGSAGKGSAIKVPPRLFDAGRRAVISRFGSSFVQAEVRFLDLGTGIHPLIPYILKGRQKVRKAKQNMMSLAFREGRATLARRKVLEAGQRLTYPSLVLNMVD
ncbi:hypothetical protein [Rhizobium oryzicola]|uniref:Uncharacterized protein n=1 Tax=Rhizobium oryzicola TaxID=1232668 RepID=A0ABT8SX24_9HYPH|nr:hypothetical protein [Rhizobium oryzicola]MDO1582428.1 hypothetical protein [Rhizobium oryzicola]